jgi:hypothetical protein
MFEGDASWFPARRPVGEPAITHLQIAALQSSCAPAA